MKSHHTFNLCIKRIVVEQVDAMKLFAVCLGHGDNVLISSEYFNLELATSNIGQHLLLK